MAKQEGYIKIKGTLGGLTFYRRNGESIIRTVSSINKHRYKTDPAFKRFRENMVEFGGSAKAGKSLRVGFATIIKKMGDSTIVGRITGLMKRINSVGPGLRGQRAIEIVNNKKLIECFEFSKEASFDKFFYAPYSTPTLDAIRNHTTWYIPNFNTDEFITAPEGATHFKLVLASTVLSNYTYNTLTKTYEAVNTTVNEINGVSYTSYLSLGGMLGADIDLSVDLGLTNMLPATSGVVVAVGILFYQEINAQLYELEKGKVMRIEVVG